MADQSPLIQSVQLNGTTIPVEDPFIQNELMAYDKDKDGVFGSQGDVLPSEFIADTLGKSYQRFVSVETKVGGATWSPNAEFLVELTGLIRETNEMLEIVNRLELGTERSWLADITVSDTDAYEKKVAYLLSSDLDKKIRIHSERLKRFIDGHFVAVHAFDIGMDAHRKVYASGYGEFASRKLKYEISPYGLKGLVDDLFTLHAELESRIKIGEVECDASFYSLTDWCFGAWVSNDPKIANENMFNLGTGYSNKMYVLEKNDAILKGR